jgi:hypothetical protein
LPPVSYRTAALDAIKRSGRVPGANINIAAAAPPAAAGGRKLLQSAQCLYTGLLGNIFISNFDVRGVRACGSAACTGADACARLARHRKCAHVRSLTTAHAMRV